MNARSILSTLAVGACLVGTAGAAEIFVSSNITTSTTWTANNTYNLTTQIYVEPGATLTIEAGTVVASTPTVNGAGSIAVARGAQIFVNGTKALPVIMTSTADVATWTGGNPRTGVWREAANEWGNLTILGNGYISENCGVTNTAFPNPSNRAPMEGLLAHPMQYNEYGGGNDNDDSGSISYLSLRYGGRVVGLTNELNGLSLGGVGRGTEIHHVEVMNNVDDGIEIWGGTVNLKYFSIWNVGDDSLDVDQGWRGKAQFGLLVQGYSVNAAQGSGVGDNIFETDGAENSDYQPVTTTSIYNVTAIGQPDANGGDHVTTWRDNARVQYHNCIFMSPGEELVRNDNTDGDAPCPGGGYGLNGTLTFAQTWTTAFNAVPAHANDFTSGTYATNYPAQSSGFLAEITDSIVYNVGGIPAALTTANAVGVFNVANNNVNLADPDLSDVPTHYNVESALPGLPIASITRGPLVVRGTKNMLPVVALDPRPANDALTSVGVAPNDGFYTPARYRGAFAPGATPWIAEWTASSAFGFTPSIGDCPGEAYCFNDGLSSPPTTPCPCGNTGWQGNGCASSFNAGGANITADGLVLSDNVVLTGAGMQATGICVFIQGSAIDPNGFLFGDGVTCTGGSIIRLRGVALAAGSAKFPVPPETVTLSQRGGVTVGSGAIRSYAVFYRNAAAAFCPPFTFNVSNSYRITW